MYQNEGSYPPVTSVRVSNDGNYFNLTDHLAGDAVGTTATVDQYIDTCGGGSFYKTECDFSFTEEPGLSMIVNVLYSGTWYSYETAITIVPNEATTMTLECEQP